MKAVDPKAIETLRISDRDREELLEEVEQLSVRPVQEDRRRLRVAYTNSKAVLSLFSETGSETKFVVMPRNLSRLGVAFVHGRFMFSETRCELALQKLDGSWQAVPGKIKSCRHVQGMVHEIAVVFSEPIDLPAFADLSAEQEMLYLEDVNAELSPEEASKIERMTGRVLVVDTFPVDRKLFSLWLKRAGFVCEASGSTAEAIMLLQGERFDLLLVDLRVGHEEGLKLIREVNGLGRDLPVIAMSAEDSEKTRQDALDAGASVFLAKPFTEAALVEHAEKMVGVDLDDKTDLIPIFSTSASDADLRPLLAEFVRGLQGYMTKLREASASRNLDQIRHLARTLKGAGAGYGFAPITDAAAELLTGLDDAEHDAAQLKTQVNELMQVLNRVRL